MDKAETKEYPAGDYAIIELFGHTTLVGRIAVVHAYDEIPS